MIGLVNFFIDVRNIIAAWIPLLCYLGAGLSMLVAICAFQRFGHPGRAARGDAWVAVIFTIIAAALASFIALVNALNITFGLPARVETGGALEALLGAGDLPAFDPATPEDWFLGMLAIFMPFFLAVGTASILRGIWLLKDSTREGVNVAVRVGAFTTAGVILMNLDTLVAMIFAEAG